MVLLFCIVSYLGLITNFNDQRKLEHQRFEREIDSLIDRLSQRLRQQAEIIPFLDGMREALLSNNKEAISNIFDQHWTLLHFHSGVEFVRLYNTSNELTADWGITELNVNDDGVILKWIKEVHQNEIPISPLLCRQNCIQLTVAPLLIEGQTAGIAVIGISLADALLAFKRISGADIGLLLHNSSSADLEALHIESWESSVVALTNKVDSYKILNAASKAYSFTDSLKNIVQINWNHRHHQIKLYPLNSVNKNMAHLVVISDVTSAVNNIYDSVWKIALIGLLGLIISEFLLFSIFTRLLSRLKDVSFTLPLLASGQFEDFRHSLTLTKKKQTYRDEIDMLYDAAVELSRQLEDLEQKVSSRAKLLIAQKDELSRERDFVANLLDTAQVIVLTQNSSGKIISMNAYGEMLTYYAEDELKNTPFLNILVSDFDSHELSMHLDEINQGLREQLRHEAITHCKDGTTRHVAWLHSRLSWNSIDDPSILSVGLDITEYKRVEGHLAWLADHDPLTNLYNRRRFSDELEQAISRSDRYHHTGALLFFDLDRFKYINDTSGHQAGDALLRMVAGMLLRTIRSDDISARLGGDEFAVILPEINTEGAIEVAKKVLAHLSETQLTINGRTHKVSASIGIALFPEHGENVHDLLAAADLAMYQAKDTGRNAWYLFSKEDRSRERVQTLVYWKEKIEYALLHDRFMLYFQPIMNVHSKEINHYEVLLRMHDVDGSILSPAGFITAAEHTGLIHSIDHMVLHKAIMQAAKINQNKKNSISLSINLSAHAFNDPELLPIIKQKLVDHKVDPKTLMFEITETAALENLPGARALMKEIKDLGCGFVLDDFGVGFSSFYYLRELPVDTVKIDGSFIRNIIENKDDQILVEALCSVASGFGKNITAEFVENEKVFRVLGKMKIDYAQGYYIGKPAPYGTYFFQDREL
ncbi:PAS domain S-box-containing protein/diguanylate cyclase (GGDEF) domain-containing protein [Nitrosomonas sp. Nm51]|uniref:bifunctional diguanylate cyclase/phosphodiesterase n=1 Tax=Nitrosomonas sp. Nm51 TaxID=133720 RepID=UPI0008CDF60B|nr:EAL domain-containing protein [Nitrosomonas sp. Nm51]SER83432.1 PAS domain S-box-containing protein/diguanylate cyclase (GGDEF) domain-containing protein [Nitrosomonas sp. Nm51]